MDPTTTRPFLTPGQVAAAEATSAANLERWRSMPDQGWVIELVPPPVQRRRMSRVLEVYSAKARRGGLERWATGFSPASALGALRAKLGLSPAT